MGLFSRLSDKACCYICGQKDLKSSMGIAYYYIYEGPTHERYYHDACVKAVICEPEAHGHSAVDRALWVEEYIAAERRREKETTEYMNKRIKEAQARICSEV